MNIIIIVVMHVFHYSAHEPPADIFFSCSHDITNMWVPHESYFSIFYQVWGIPLLRSNNIQYDSNVVYWFVGRTIDVQPHSKRHTWKLHALRTFAEHGFFFTGVAVQEWVKRMYHMHKWQGLFNWFWAAYTSICLYTCVCVCVFATSKNRNSPFLWLPFCCCYVAAIRCLFTQCKVERKYWYKNPCKTLDTSSVCLSLYWNKV